ncbi:HlyD family secretion protein [Parvibaculum sp.]|uniref:HlyD family secretion protein n=1 Tax=Parvibaculum sp. TaxID=2024848 RepID=UPI002CE6C953|nr:HlyD family secretion protein [Parvibaculum sp.]HUD52814.1 HlyD family secretion protein [Parvibaculum sp.]
MSVTFAPVSSAARRILSDREQLRPLLLIGVPALLLVAMAWFYFTAGRYVSTDNAYVKADMVSVSPDVGGRIVEVFVRQNQFVKAGDPLFQIDPAPYKIALAEADAQLATATANVKSLRAKYDMTIAQLALSDSSIAYYKREFERQASLAKRSFASQANLDTARHNFDTATQLDGVLRQSLAQIAAQLDGKPDAPVEEHASYLAAKAQRDNAALNLERATVRAPFDGVAGKQPQVGDQVSPGMPVVSLVSNEKVWIEGNFKETDLTNVHPGQTASIDIDTYPGHAWTGHVASISQATGSEFSVLPAQNATGNWVKVVQRIPVRIAIDRKPGDPEIRAGMSVDVEIDTKSQPAADAGDQGRAP